MAIETLKSTVITARDYAQANYPYTTPSIRLAGAVIKEAVATFEFAAGLTAGSTYRICEIPARARIVTVYMKCDDAINSTGAIHIGLYQTTANGGAVALVSILASAVALTTGITTAELNLRYEATNSYLHTEWEAWQDATNNAGPIPASGTYYDVVATTSTEINTTGGTVSFTVRYVDGT